MIEASDAYQISVAIGRESAEREPILTDAG